VRPNQGLRSLSAGFSYLPRARSRSCVCSCFGLSSPRYCGRQAEAETALAPLKALKGDGAAYEYATI